MELDSYFYVVFLKPVNFHRLDDSPLYFLIQVALISLIKRKREIEGDSPGRTGMGWEGQKNTASVAKFLRLLSEQVNHSGWRGGGVVVLKKKSRKSFK